MVCDKCGKEIKENEKFFTAVGIVHCSDCDINCKGTISMDEVFSKIIKKKQE